MRRSSMLKQPTANSVLENKHRICLYVTSLRVMRLRWFVKYMYMDTHM